MEESNASRIRQSKCEESKVPRTKNQIYIRHRNSDSFQETASSTFRSDESSSYLETSSFAIRNNSNPMLFSNSSFAYTEETKSEGSTPNGSPDYSPLGIRGSKSESNSLNKIKLSDSRIPFYQNESPKCLLQRKSSPPSFHSNNVYRSLEITTANEEIISKSRKPECESASETSFLGENNEQGFKEPNFRKRSPLYCNTIAYKVDPTSTDFANLANRNIPVAKIVVGSSKIPKNQTISHPGIFHDRNALDSEVPRKCEPSITLQSALPKSNSSAELNNRSDDILMSQDSDENARSTIQDSAAYVTSSSKKPKKLDFPRPVSTFSNTMNGGTTGNNDTEFSDTNSCFPITFSRETMSEMTENDAQSSFTHNDKEETENEKIGEVEKDMNPEYPNYPIAQFFHQAPENSTNSINRSGPKPIDQTISTTSSLSFHGNESKSSRNEDLNCVSSETSHQTQKTVSYPSFSSFQEMGKMKSDHIINDAESNVPEANWVLEPPGVVHCYCAGNVDRLWRTVRDCIVNKLALSEKGLDVKQGDRCCWNIYASRNGMISCVARIKLRSLVRREGPNRFAVEIEQTRGNRSIMLKSFRAEIQKAITENGFSLIESQSFPFSGMTNSLLPDASLFSPYPYKNTEPMTSQNSLPFLGYPMNVDSA